MSPNLTRRQPCFNGLSVTFFLLGPGREAGLVGMFLGFGVLEAQQARLTHRAQIGASQFLGVAAVQEPTQLRSGEGPQTAEFEQQRLHLGLTRFDPGIPYARLKLGGKSVRAWGDCGNPPMLAG